MKVAPKSKLNHLAKFFFEIVFTHTPFIRQRTQKQIIESSLSHQ